ncbi:hypothetical protein B0H67DRAFT_290814 [Lasiosphaeris hirsuta]|uniref:Uncharacterized protein n=1 Tax=Lasiosphaeris hirsuta TaxID=260670 RepID=A0AA40A8W3_9PEZI|nr:hypothetical protein B0H67DRAFT_290814 [Lasiosphaeris hirsuta]
MLVVGVEYVPLSDILTLPTPCHPISFYPVISNITPPSCLHPSRWPLPIWQQYPPRCLPGVLPAAMRHSKKTREENRTTAARDPHPPEGPREKRVKRARDGTPWAQPCRHLAERSGGWTPWAFFLLCRRRRLSSDRPFAPLQLPLVTQAGPPSHYCRELLYPSTFRPAIF